MRRAKRGMGYTLVFDISIVGVILEEWSHKFGVMGNTFT